MSIIEFEGHPLVSCVRDKHLGTSDISCLMEITVELGTQSLEEILADLLAIRGAPHRYARGIHADKGRPLARRRMIW